MDAQCTLELQQQQRELARQRKTGDGLSPDDYRPGVSVPSHWQEVCQRYNFANMN